MAYTGYKPLITIAIPTYNRATWLPGCVRAALAQSYDHFEVLVSDNASTDQTTKVLESFCDRRLRVVSREHNLGILPNWNACLAEAKGDYIVFVSDDDLIEPWLLERCVALIKCEPQIPIVIALSDFSLVAQDRMLFAKTSQRHGTGIYTGVEILEEFLQGQISAPMCTILIRTETLRARGGFPINLANTGDTAGWAPILLTGKAGLVNERCGTCSIHSSSQSARVDPDMLIRELRELADLITITAESTIQDLKTRSKIKLLANRYVALSGIYLLGSRRKEGAKFVEVLPILWRRRRALSHIELRDVFRLARPIAFLILPGPLTSWLRSFMRKQQGSKSIAVE